MASKRKYPYGKEYDAYLRPSQRNYLLLREADEAKARQALRENMHSDRFELDWNGEEDER